MNSKALQRAVLHASGASVAVAAALAFAAPALGQATVPAGQSEAQQKAAAGAVTPPAAQQEGEGNEVVVTGTRLRSPNQESAVPITSISGETFFQTGQISVGDQLNELPSIRSTFSTQNSTRFLGTAGLNLLDLRGLCTQRTLVLVNGRRHVGADILLNAVSTDINTIPTDLIERFDIISGGQSGVYGSDAIAGVVNFVLKDHYDGVQARAQSGTSSQGDAGSYYASILAGKNFAGGRGNIAANLEFAHQTDFYGSERSNLRNTNSFVVVDTDPSGSDGVPDRIFMHDVRSTTIANGGLVTFKSPTGACGHDNNLGANFNCTFLFQPDGSLVPQTGTRVGIGPNGSFLGGNGTNLREGHQLVLQPRQDRYTGNIVAHYEISSAFVPYIESTFAHVVTTGSTSGPAFFQGSTLDANLERPRLDNPFLSAQARALITSQMIASGTAPSSITDSTQFKLQENLLDLGVRNEASKRDTFRIVVGLKGDFGSGWHYDISGNYGQFKESTKIEGNLNVQRFLLAMDSTRNAAGQIVCRSQVDPTAGDAAQAATAFGDIDNRLPTDISACVPLNPFGSGNVSQAAKQYVLQDTVSHGKITQTDVTATLSGDSSKWFELPGGPIGIGIGGEYRRETNKFTADPLVQDGYTFYNALPSFRPPAFEVKEAFGELRVPLLKNIPLIRELTVLGSGRVSRYKGSAGTVYAYDGKVEWRPVNDLLIRGGYARSVRAPNLTELYSAQSQNFAPGFVDPCSARNIGTGSSHRAANCAAAGIPTSYDFVYTQSLETLSGGNPNLKAETSDSYTLGGVLTPHWVPGLTFSVDYYKITVNNVIAAVDAQTIADQCYDSPSLNNPYCALFKRAGAGGGPKGEVEHQILDGSLLASTLNFAKLKARGIYVDLAYHHRFGNVDLSSHGVWTHVLQRSDYLNPTDPNFEDRIRGELGDPKDNFNWTTDARIGKVTLTYELRYIGQMYLSGSAAENYESVNGDPPQNADYADVARYKAVLYHMVRVNYDVSNRFSIYLGADNITNRLPPFGLSGVNDGGGVYDNRGRFLYTGVVAKF